MIRTAVILLSVWNLFGLLPGDRVELRDISGVFEEKRLTVRGRVTGIEPEDLRQALESGETLIFDYHVELRRERGIWFDEFVEEFHYQKKLSFDTLTRQYFARSEVDGTDGEAIIHEDLAHAVQWLTALDRWEIPTGLVLRDGKTYIRGRVVLRRRKLLLVIPWETATPWSRAPVTFP